MTTPGSTSEALLFAGKYRLISPIGRGAMGEVWLAEEEGPRSFRRKVAVKRLTATGDISEFATDSFIAEAQVIARIDHPNVVRLIEFGAVEGELYLVLAYVDGLALNRIIKRCGCLSPQLVAYIGREVARALEAVHQLADDEGNPYGVVHRDVSPSNILIGRDGRVRLSDFGVARISGLSGDQTEIGLIKGKLSYMPPEQVSGQPFDGSADIFALGITLFEALLGRKLRRAESEAQLAFKIATERAPYVSESLPNLPQALALAIDSALEFSAIDRPKSAGELAQLLDDALLSYGPQAARDACNELKALIVATTAAFSTGDSSPSSRFANPVAPAPPSSRNSLRSNPPPRPSHPSHPSHASHSISQPMVSDLPVPVTRNSDPSLTRPAMPSHAPAASTHSLSASTKGVSGFPNSPPSRVKKGWIVGLAVAVGCAALATIALRRTEQNERADSIAKAEQPVEQPVKAVTTVAAAKPEEEAPVVQPEPAAPSAPLNASAPSTQPAEENRGERAARTAAPDAESSRAANANTVANAGRPANHRGGSRPSPSPAGSPPNDTDPTTPGTLQVTVLPWGEVTVDGRSVGETPLAPLSLSPGSHTVVVRNGDLGAVRSMAVTVKPGKPVSIKLDLRRSSEER